MHLEVPAELEKRPFHADAELPDRVVGRSCLLGSPEPEGVVSSRNDVESPAVVHDLEPFSVHRETDAKVRKIRLLFRMDLLRPVYTVVDQIENRSLERNVPHQHVDEERLCGHCVDLVRVVCHRRSAPFAGSLFSSRLSRSLIASGRVLAACVPFPCLGIAFPRLEF